jgi:hypothetical protein
MAFNPTNLTFGRGIFNNFSSENGPAQHIYSSNDSIALMTSNGYFPPYFGTSLSDNQSQVKENDILALASSSDSISLSYLISSINPIILNTSAESYDEYFGVSYSGASSGTLDIAFSRTGNLVTFYVLSTASLSTGSGGHYLLNLSPPRRYLPAADYNLGSTPGNVLLPCPLVNGVSALFADIVIRSLGNIQIFQMPSSDFLGGATVTLHNFSGSYRGIDLTS